MPFVPWLLTSLKSQMLWQMIHNRRIFHRNLQSFFFEGKCEEFLWPQILCRFTWQSVLSEFRLHLCYPGPSFSASRYVHKPMQKRRFHMCTKLEHFLLDFSGIPKLSMLSVCIPVLSPHLSLHYVQEFLFTKASFICSWPKYLLVFPVLNITEPLLIPVLGIQNRRFFHITDFCKLRGYLTKFL